MKPGDAFVIDPDGGTNLHLWIVLSVFTPDLETAPWAVIVNVTSMSAHADTTCVLAPDDSDAHPFIDRKSFVAFARMREVAVRDLETLVRGNLRPPACPAFLARLRGGVHRSPHTRRGFKSKVPRQ